MNKRSAARRVSFALGLPVLVLAGFLAYSHRGTAHGPVSMEAASRLELPHVRSSFSPKNQGDDAGSRYEYKLMRLRDPATGRIPMGIRTRELAFVRNVPRADELAAKSGRLLAEKWTFRGPNNVGGRTRALAIDLDYNGTSNRRVLAGGISGGVYLSEDDGQTWTLTTSLSHLASVTCLAQDPVNRNVWYHGTGELTGNSAGGGLGQFNGQGVFKSVDGGRTWAQLASTVEGELEVFDSLWDFVWNIAVHPSGVVVAATFGGIYRSADQGQSWDFVLGNAQGPFSSSTDVVIAPDGDVYAALSRNGSGSNTYGIFKSSNAGGQWEDVTPADLVIDPYRMVLAPAPSDANALYVLAQTNQEGAASSDHQFFRYNDAAASWTNLSTALPNEEGVEGNASFSTQGGYDQMVKVKPDNANTVFIGGTNLYRSTDGGNTFTRIGGYHTPANYAQFNNHHSDQHSLTFLPTNPNLGISGHDGGLSKSSNILAEPHSWTSLNNGYVTTQFYAVAIDPQPGGLAVIGGLQDNGTWGTDTEDASQEWFDLFGGDGAHAAITPGATAYYVSAQNGLTYRLRSSVFTNITPAGADEFMFINPFVLDPNDARIMYMGEAGGVWRNGNLDGIPGGGQQPTSTNWTFLNSSAIQGTRTTAVAAAGTPADRVYFGTTDFQSQTAIVRVDNAQSNGPGTVITPPVTSQGFAPYPSSIAVNPDDGDEVIAVFSNYNVLSIWHSTNAGATWTNIEGNLGGANGPSVRTAAIVPTAAGTMYFVGTSTGVYSTTNPGVNATWALEGGDVLGNVVVDMLVARPEDGTIVAGTHGRGVYQATIGQGGASAVASVDAMNLQIESRPDASGMTTFTLTNTGSAELTFALGALGKNESVASKHRLRPDPTLRRASDRAWKSGGPRPLTARAAVTHDTGSAPTSGDFLILDDGSDFPDTYLGWGDGTTPFQWGSRFIAPVGGFTLESFYIFMRSESASSLPVSIFVSNPDGELYVSGSLTLPPSTNGDLGEWYYIFFDPISLPEGQPFDIEIVTPAEILFPAGVDTEGQIPQSGFYWVNSGLDGFYAELSGIEGFEDGSWLIRAEGTAGGSLNIPPTASFTASKTQVAVGESVAFDGSDSRDPDGSIVGFSWAFGDGATSTLQSPVHAFAQPGVYPVELTVTDDQGATGQAIKDISVASNNQPPIARIQTSKIQAEVNEAVTFDGSGSSDPDGTIEEYAWTFGDGGTSDQQVAVHAYASAGSYSVGLTVTDNEGLSSRSTVRLDVVEEPSRLTVSPLNGMLGPGESQVITVTYDATGQVAGNYSGEVRLTTNGGDFTIPVAILVDPSVGIGTEKELPEQLTLDQNYPNPFNPETTIRFTLDRPAGVTLTVFDLNGRVVRVLLEGSRPTGTHLVTWDGEDAGGRPAASGTYLYRLETTGPSGEIATHFTRKMTLVR